MTFITFLLFILILYLIFKGILFKKSPISSSTIAIVFAIKFLAITASVNYLDHHPAFDLKGDHEAYLNDSYVLNAVFYQEPTTYFKLLTGLDDTDITKEKFLSHTKLWNNPYLAYNDCRTVIRIHSLVDFIAFGNAYFHLLLVNLLTIFSCLLLTKAFSKYIKKKTLLFLVLSLGIPTFFFYGGLVLKEHLLFFGMASFAYALSTNKLKSIYFWIGLFLLVTVKQYIFGIILFSYFIHLIFKQLKSNTSKLAALIIGCIIVLLSLFTPAGTKAVVIISNQQYAFDKVATEGIYLHDWKSKSRDFYYYLNIKDTALLKDYDENNFKLREDVVASKHSLPSNEFIDSVQLHKGEIFINGMIVPKNSGSYVKPHFIHYEKIRLLENIPSSIFYTLSQPTFLSPGSSAKYPIALETTLLFIVICLSFIYTLFYQRKMLIHPLVISFIFFILATASIVGVTTPVIGAMVRYRVPTFIAIVILSFILIDSIWKEKSPSSQEQVQE